MPNKKRHHYIPRFYLKRFSVKGEGKFIGLYNHKNDRFVNKAPLRHQAYENFLYGVEDEIEDALANMEKEMAKLFSIGQKKNFSTHHLLIPMASNY